MEKNVLNKFRVALFFMPKTGMVVAKNERKNKDPAIKDTETEGFQNENLRTEDPKIKNF